MIDIKVDRTFSRPKPGELRITYFARSIIDILKVGLTLLFVALLFIPCALLIYPFTRTPERVRAGQYQSYFFWCPQVVSMTVPDGDDAMDVETHLCWLITRRRFFRQIGTAGGDNISKWYCLHPAID